MSEAARAIRLLALTGMRRDEVLNLTWPQVDWRQGMLRLPDSKTGKRDVVVSDEVLALLREIADAKGNPKNGRVVCSRTGQKLASLNVTWRRVRKLAGLDDVRLHDLRHSVASDAIMDGVPSRSSARCSATATTTRPSATPTSPTPCSATPSTRPARPSPAPQKPSPGG
jgi:integrase